MEEQEIREAKRARNFIWMAAEDYRLEPLYLAFSPDGTADMYLNLVTGLVYKWYGQGKIDSFFNQLGGKDRELYEGLLWIGLENAVFQKEKETRSALGDLRYEYAMENLRRYRTYKEYSRIEQIRNGHVKEILGIPSGLKKEDEEILHAFAFTKDMTAEEILEETRKNLWNYFSYRPSKVDTKEGTYFLQKVSGAFHAIGRVNHAYVRAKMYENTEGIPEGNAGTLEHKKHYLLQLAFHDDPEGTKQYVCACFGKSIYPVIQEMKIEKMLCTEAHRNCHLLFTKGELETEPEISEEITKKRERKEIEEFRAESVSQYEKNRRYFEKNRAVYQNSIRRLTDKLKICLETADEIFPEMSTHGRIVPSNVWKAVYLNNPRVFERNEEIEQPDFSVDILIDASSSRKQMQEQIAAQAYVLSESLRRCQIPSQISSYCSIRSYTVIRIFKRYEEDLDVESVFQYVAAGNNRDGLALKAAGYLMEQSRKAGKILLVFTDASPQDDQESAEGAFYKNREYTDLLAVQDTAKEVQRLRQKGVRVIGIFMGSERSKKVAGKIYGRDMVVIRKITEFSDAVGRILQKVINE